MPLLRTAAFLTYLLAWLAMIAGAIGSWFGPKVPAGESAGRRALMGTLLQVAGAVAVVLLMREGPLRPSGPELWLVLVLAPGAAALFLGAVYAGRRAGLVTSGVFGLVRHPMYLSFLAMLAATAAVVTAGLPSLAGLALYVAGSELRIAEEEADLLARFGEHFSAYRQRVPWRYLPWLR